MKALFAPLGRGSGPRFHLSTLALAVACTCAGVAQAQAPAAAHTQADSAAAAPTVAANTAASTAAKSTLPQVTVTATRNEIDVRTAPASVTVYDREQIENHASDDLLDVIEETPGLTLSGRQVGGRKVIALRGMNSAHTLMLIDGRRISASDDVVGHSDYQYGWVPLSAIERVEVIRGPLSALYGSEALGGVVNIITRWPTDKWQGSISASGQRAADNKWGGSGSKFSAYAGGPLAPGLSLRVNAETNHVSPVVDRNQPQYNEIEGRNGGSGGLAARYELNAHHSFEAGWQQGRERRYYDDVSRTRQTYQNTYTLDRTHGYAQWNGSFGSGVKTQLRAYRSTIDIENSRTNGVANTRPQNLKDVVGDGFVQWSLGRHRLAAGGEWRRESLVNNGLTHGKASATHKALFVQDEFALTPNVAATLGLRADHHEIFGSKYSPRAYLVWQASPSLIVKGGAGTAFKAPTLKQISPTYVGAEGPHTFLGNANIKPETSRSFEIGADWQVSSALSLRGTLFHTRVKDLIYYRLLRIQGPRRTYQYDNVDRATMRGAELGLSWDILPSLRWNNDLTLLRTKDDRTGLELTGRPRQTLRSQLQWQHPSGWNARLGLNLTGKQKDSTTTRLPSYTTFDASVGQQLNKTISWRAGVDNLTDVRLADKSDSFGYAIRGRTWFVNLTASF